MICCHNNRDAARFHPTLQNLCPRKTKYIKFDTNKFKIAVRHTDIVASCGKSICRLDLSTSPIRFSMNVARSLQRLETSCLTFSVGLANS